MNYDKADFFALIERVEEQGGEHLDAMCVARDFEWCGDKLKPATLPGCGQIAQFAVPYEGMKGTKDNGPVQVCAVDDSMGAWPRFGNGELGRN